MFDIGWSELFVIAVVAVIVVGPKDLPKMLRTFGNWVAKMKRMAGDFQREFNDAIRESELEDVKKSIQDIGKIDPLADVRSAMDSANQIGNDIQRELQKPVDEPGAPAAANVEAGEAALPAPTAEATPTPEAAPTPGPETTPEPAPTPASSTEASPERPAETAGSTRP